MMKVPVGLSRRVAIGSVLAGAGVALLPWGGIARADEGPMSFTLFEDLSYVATGSESLVAVPHILGGVFHFSRPRQAGTRVEVRFDERLYELDRDVLVVCDGEVVRAGVQSSDAGVVAVVIDDAIVEGRSYELICGRRVLISYPNDIVETPFPSEFRVDGQLLSDGASRRALTAAVSEPVWGMSVGAGWSRTDWGDGFHSWVPELVTLWSTGPMAVPAGTVVGVDLDGRLVSSVRLFPRSGAGSISMTSVGRLMRVEWELNEPVPAGEFVSASLEFALAELTGAVEGFNPPSVLARPPSKVRGQRVTGHESLQREDSAHDLATRATYGFGT